MPIWWSSPASSRKVTSSLLSALSELYFYVTKYRQGACHPHEPLEFESAASGKSRGVMGSQGDQLLDSHNSSTNKPSGWHA